MSIDYWFDAARVLLEGVISASGWGMFIGTFGIFTLMFLVLMILTEDTGRL